MKKQIDNFLNNKICEMYLVLYVLVLKLIKQYIYITKLYLIK